jgi:hypothetical protein
MTGTHTDTIDPQTGSIVTFTNKTRTIPISLSDNISGGLPSQVHNPAIYQSQKKDKVLFYEDFESYSSGDRIHNCQYYNQSAGVREISVSNAQSYIGSNSLKFQETGSSGHWAIMPIHANGLTNVNISFWQYIDYINNGTNSDWFFYVIGQLQDNSDSNYNKWRVVTLVVFEDLASGNNVKYYHGSGYTNFSFNYTLDAWKLNEIGIRVIRDTNTKVQWRYSYDKGDQLGWTATRTDVVGNDDYFVPTHLYWGSSGGNTANNLIYIDKVEVKSLDPTATGLHNI